MRHDYENLVTLAFDFAADQSTGFTDRELAAHLGVDHRTVRDVIQKLRDVLGHDDSINLVCEPQGQRQKWLYRLVGNMEDSRWWAANRILDTERRIRTQYNVCRAMARATDGRTIEGRKARIFERSLQRLLEDVDALAE